MKKGFLILFFGACFMAGLFNPVKAGSIENGKRVYQNYCARCHGAEGRGDGMDAKRVPVLPRDFTRQTYKFRSTTSGSPPSDADLMYSINHGIPGSGMPAFANLPTPDKEDVIAFLKTITASGEEKSDFEKYEAEPIPPPNEKIKPNLVNGKEVYAKMGCALCHGDGGRANGTSAPGLVDSEGEKLKVANLTQGWTYRAGSTPTQIYYRFMAGIAGAAMPGFYGAVSQEDGWDLSNYVYSLQIKENWSGRVASQKWEGNLPETPGDSVWNTVPHLNVPLESHFYVKGTKVVGSINEVQLQTVFNADGAAFKLSWNDPTESSSNPPDQILMAVRPASLTGGGHANLHTLYAPNSPELDLMVWAANNPSQVSQRMANLHLGLKSWASTNETYKGAAQYQDGLWSLVFYRPFSKEDQGDFSTQRPSIELGFAGWDGSSGESDLRRSESQWVTVFWGDLPRTEH